MFCPHLHFFSYHSENPSKDYNNVFLKDQSFPVTQRLVVHFQLVRQMPQSKTNVFVPNVYLHMQNNSSHCNMFRAHNLHLPSACSKKNYIPSLFYWCLYCVLASIGAYNFCLIKRN